MFYGREAEMERLSSFVESSKSAFMVIRGRRRIGKSWLLSEFNKRFDAFSFQGDEDSTNQQLMRKFAEQWKAFSGDDTLSIIRLNDLSWLRIFNTLSSWFQTNPNKNHVIVLDEIQWIAKRKSGFLSQLKEAWVKWEPMGNVKIIICGSSQRFFINKTSSETSILHRMRTVADLKIYPFSLSEIQKHYFPHWTKEQICLVFMMTGGVPYYLERIPRDDNFIRAINKAFFTQDTIFLDEFREVINLEFTKASALTAEKILGSLGQDGSTLDNIRKKSRIKSESTVRAMVDQLLEFDIVVEKTKAGEKKANRRGSKFYMKDPFLNFYFQILRSMAPQIQKNQRSNLFQKCVGSKTGYYIENFSGKGFELLTEWILRQELSPSGTENLLWKLDILDSEYSVGHFWEEGKTQVDLIIECETDRESRLLELKWVNSRADISSEYIPQVREKNYSQPKGWTISYHVLLSAGTSAPLQKQAKAARVQILELEDLF